MLTLILIATSLFCKKSKNLIKLAARIEKLDIYTSKTYDGLMEFIETPLFTKLINEYLNEEEYIRLQWYLALHPESGDIIPESGGLRKIRWTAKGQGKRGGTRIIYYYKSSERQIWLLTIYSKSEKEDISKAVLKKIKQELNP